MWFPIYYWTVQGYLVKNDEKKIFTNHNRDGIHSKDNERCI